MPVREERPRFAILASGRGSNAEALMRTFARGAVAADLVAVVTNVADAGVLERAREHNIPGHVLVSKGMAREAHEQALLALLGELGVQHILLAGYLRILSSYFLSRFSGRTLNIHPSLLP